MKKNEDLRHAVLIGIDWADQNHEFRLLSTGEKQREKGTIRHSPEDLTDWVMQLRRRFPEGTIAICLEQTRGALVYFLMQFDFIVLYPVNPITAKNFRKALYPSGSKSDPVDADLLLDLLEKHRDRLRPWTPEPTCVRKLELVNRHRRNVVDQITSLTNSLRANLKAYYPQALNLAGELNTIQACDFLEKWPSMEAIKRAKSSRVRKFYQAHNCRKSQKIQDRIQSIRSAEPITRDDAICCVHQLTVLGLAAQVRALLKVLKKFDNELTKAFGEFPEVEFYTSLPGAGPVLGPRLAAAFGLNRDKYQAASELQAFSGIAPVTEKSGRSRWVHWRMACPKFVRQTFVEFADHSRKKSVWAKAYYEAQRFRGSSHQAALRSLAFKWIRILFRCWKDRKPYNEQTYLNALQKRGSSLLELLPKTA